MKKLLVLLGVLLVAQISAQSRHGTESLSTSLPQGFGLGLLNSYGTSSIYNDISNISFMNPASINQFDNYSFGLSYQFNTNIEEGYYVGIGTNRIHNFVPQSFGAVIKFDDFTFGLSFGQDYNLSIDLGPIPITTFQYPDGTGEFIHPIFETVVQDFSLTTAYSLLNVFGKDRLNFGLKFSLGRFYDNAKLRRIEFNAQDYCPAVSIGILYNHSMDLNRNIEFGIVYKSKMEFKGVFESNPDLLDLDPDTLRGSSFYVISPAAAFSAHLPDEINTDLSIDVTDKFKLLTSFNAVLWNSQSTNWENQFIYSTSAVFKFSEKVDASFGFYSSGMELKEENYFSRDENDFDVFFLTAGVKLSYNLFNVDIALADSHLLSGEFRKQTIGKIALGLKL